MVSVKINATIILAGILFSIIPISFVSIHAESIETEGTFASNTNGLIFNMFSPQQYHADFVKTNWTGDDTVASMRMQALLNYEDQKKILIITEYSQLDAAIKTALDNNIQYLAYNNEGMNGDLSAPTEEVEQAAYYIELIADKTHAAGLDFISAPSFRIMIDVVNDVNWSEVDAEQILFQLQRSKSTQQIIDQFNEKASIIRPQAPNSTFVVQLNPEWQSIDDIRLVLESTNGEIGGIGIVCNTDACTEDFLSQLLAIRTQYTFETDQDGDGISSNQALNGTPDCNDTDSSIHPGATEILYDGIDQNCDGADSNDQDGDGISSNQALNGTPDCNDTDSSIYPGATEILYDGIDQNCDGKDLSSLSLKADAGEYDPIEMNKIASLDGSLSSNPNSKIVLYEWDLNEDGIFNDAIGINPSVIFDSTGILKIGLKITNNLGETATDTSNVVVYDPKNGFITGSGWINFPKGAYYYDSNLDGKANFGFVSKYVTKNNQSSKVQEFQFQFGDFVFNSNSFQMKVSNDEVKAALKGEGTINNSGNYKFWVNIVDSESLQYSDVDKIRIRIWDVDNGNSVVYDNYMMVDKSKNNESTLVYDGNIILDAFP